MGTELTTLVRLTGWWANIVVTNDFALSASSLTWCRLGVEVIKGARIYRERCDGCKSSLIGIEV